MYTGGHLMEILLQLPRPAGGPLISCYLVLAYWQLPKLHHFLASCDRTSGKDSYELHDAESRLA